MVAVIVPQNVCHASTSVILGDVQPASVGANDLATADQWYWSSPTSDSGALFWSGGLDGSNQNSMFSNWASGAPGNKSCATISPVDGTWSDTDCSQTLGYLCEYLFHY